MDDDPAAVERARADRAAGQRAFLAVLRSAAPEGFKKPPRPIRPARKTKPLKGRGAR